MKAPKASAAGRRIVAALALCASWARADDTSELESLLDENVVTTVSASAERASVAPATSVTITAEELRTYGIRSIAEAIDFLSLGLVTSDPLRTPDMGSRGVLLTNDGGKHFLLLVNGHSINDPLYGAARFDQGAGIPIELVDHLEVAIGPGSVVYGSNAMLGVINVITKDARAYKGGHVLGEYEPGRSWRAGAGAGTRFNLFGTPSELTAGVEYYERFGPNLEFGEQQFPFGDTGFRRGGPPNGLWGGTVERAYFVRAPSGMLRLRTGDFEVSLLASSYRRGIPYSTGTTGVDFDDDESYERDHAARLEIRHDAALSSVVQLTSRVYGDAFAYQRRVNAVASLTCLRRDIPTCTYHDVGRAQWVGVEERLSLNWLHDGSFVTTVGADVRGQWVQSKQDALNYTTGQPLNPTIGRLDEAGSIVSPYLQQTWRATPWFDVNGGARLDLDSRFSPVLSPRAAVALQPGHGTTFKAVYSEAFRAPTWSETSLASYTVAPSDHLRAETVRSVEGSVEQRFARQRVLVGLFRTWWNDLAALEPLPGEEQRRLQGEGLIPVFVPPGLTQYRNVTSIENYGLNGSWTGALLEGRLRYGVNVTEAFTRAIRGSTSGQLPIAPAFFGNAHVALALGGQLPTLALAVSYVGRRAADRPLVRGDAIPYAAPLAEFRLTLTGKVPGVYGLGYRLSAAVATATESAYTAGPNIATVTGGAGAFAAPPLGFVPIDPFNAFFGLSYDFATGEAP